MITFSCPSAARMGRINTHLFPSSSECCTCNAAYYYCQPQGLNFGSKELTVWVCGWIYLCQKAANYTVQVEMSWNELQLSTLQGSKVLIQAEDSSLFLGEKSLTHSHGPLKWGNSGSKLQWAVDIKSNWRRAQERELLYAVASVIPKTRAPTHSKIESNNCFNC